MSSRTGRRLSPGPALVVVLGLAIALGPAALAEAQQRVLQRAASCRQSDVPFGAHQPERAAVLAEAMWGEPWTASCLLAEHGMSLQNFSDVMVEITSEPELAARYEITFGILAADRDPAR